MSYSGVTSAVFFYVFFFKLCFPSPCRRRLVIMTSIGRHNTAVLETLPRFPGVSGRSVVDYCVRTIFFLLACLLACYSCGLRETASTLDVSFLSLPVATPSLPPHVFVSVSRSERLVAHGGGTGTDPFHRGAARQPSGGGEQTCRYRAGQAVGLGIGSPLMVAD